MDTFHGPYFHFCLELALENWVKALLIHSLWVHNLGHTHSLASVQQSETSDQRTLLWTKSCLNCQKWSPYKVKGAFSTPICPRKQTNGPPVIDQGFSTGSCTATMRCQAERWTYPPPPPYLVCILFGMPSLHLHTFLLFFKSCFDTFLMLISVTVRPKPKKNISFKCNHNPTTPELETALTI